MKIFSRILPDIVISKVTELDDSRINELKEKYHIEGLILDVDDTLRHNMQPISNKNKEWLKHTLLSLKVIVVSNGYDHRVKEFLESIDVGYISSAFKPLKRPFIEASKRLDIAPEKLMVVGDSLLDDILGGKLNNMVTAWIKPKF